MFFSRHMHSTPQLQPSLYPPKNLGPKKLRNLEHLGPGGVVFWGRSPLQSPVPHQTRPDRRSPDRSQEGFYAASRAERLDGRSAQEYSQRLGAEDSRAFGSALSCSEQPDHASIQRRCSAVNFWEPDPNYLGYRFLG